MRSTRASRLAAVALVAIAAVTLASIASATSKADVTITVTDYYGPSVMGPLIKNFELANPGIKVQEQYVEPSTFVPQLTTALQAGNAADVIATNGGTGQGNSVLTLAKGGYLADLSKEPWAKRIPAAAHELYFVGSKLYGLPLGAELDGVVYNVDLMKQLKITVPKTFSQFLSACAKAKASGKSFVGLAGQNATFVLVEAAANTVYAKQPNWNTLKSQHKVTFAGTKGWKDAVNEFIAMNKAGCFQPGAAAASIPQAFNLMASGEVVTFVAPPAAIGPVVGINPKFHPGNFPFPAAKATDTRAITGYTHSLSVNAKSSQKAAAIKFVDFFAREGQNRLWAKLNGEVSLYDVNAGKVSAVNQAFLPYLKAKKTVGLPYLTWQGSLFNDIVPKGLQALLTGHTNATQLLKQMDQGWSS